MDLVSFLAAVSVRSLILAALAAIFAWRVKSPAARHAVWTLVTAGMLALAVATAILPALPVRVLRARASRPAEPAPAAFVPAPFAPTPPPRSPFPWPAACYTAGLLVFAGRLTHGYFLTRKLVRASSPVRQHDGVWQSACISVPLTVGWLRPKILLPAGWDAWQQEKLDAVLVHERHHVRRADWAIAVLAGVNRCVFWFHPLAWWLEARLKVLAEQACDDASLAQVVSPECYAQVLVEMAAAVREGEGRVGWEAMAMAKTAEVKMRVERILDESRRIFPAVARRHWVLMTLVALPTVYFVAVARPARVRAQEPAPPQAQAATQAQAAAPAASSRELNAARAELARIEAEMARFKSENAGRLPEHLPGSLAQLQDQQMQVSQANEAVGRSQQQRLELETQLMNLNNQLNYYRIHDAKLQALGRRIEEAQSQLAAANEQYTPAHPAIQRLKATLELLERQQEQESGNTLSANRKMMLDLEAAIAQIQTKIHGAGSEAEEERLRQLQEYNRMVAQYQARIESMPQVEMRYSELMRQYAEAQRRWNELTGGTIGPGLISRRDPEYTPEARRAGLQGKVELSATIGVDGIAGDLQVTRGLGSGLDQKAIECVKAWRFRPATRNGEPVTAFIIVEVPFRLQ